MTDGRTDSVEMERCCWRCGALSGSERCLACGSQKRPRYGCRRLFLADTLDEGLAWCEDMLIQEDEERRGADEGDGERDGGNQGTVPCHHYHYHCH